MGSAKTQERFQDGAEAEAEGETGAGTLAGLTIAGLLTGVCVAVVAPLAWSVVPVEAEGSGEAGEAIDALTGEADVPDEGVAGGVGAGVAFGFGQSAIVLTGQVGQISPSKKAAELCTQPFLQ